MDFLDLYEPNPARRAQYFTGRNSQGQQAPLVPVGWGDFSIDRVLRSGRPTSGGSGRGHSLQTPLRDAASSLVAGRNASAGLDGIQAGSSSSQWPTSPAKPNIGVDSLQSVLVHGFSSKQPPECAICLQHFRPGTEAAKLPCGETHIFHRDCIVEWLQRNPSCPLCRKKPEDEKTSSFRRLLQDDTELDNELERLESEMQQEIAAVNRRAAPLENQLARLEVEMRQEVVNRRSAPLENQLARLQSDMRQEIDVVHRVGRGTNALNGRITRDRSTRAPRHVR